MARKYTMRSKEEKLAIVKAVLSGTPAQYYENQGIVDHHTVMDWVRKYEHDGESGLEAKKKPRNPLSRYEATQRTHLRGTAAISDRVVKKRTGEERSRGSSA